MQRWLILMEARVCGAVVKSLTSHLNVAWRWTPDSPICGWSLLLVLPLAPGGLSPSPPFSLTQKNQHDEIQIPTRVEMKEWLGGCVTPKLLFVCSIPTILSGSNKKIMYFEPNFLSLLTSGAKFTFIWKMIAFKWLNPKSRTVEFPRVWMISIL